MNLCKLFKMSFFCTHEPKKHCQFYTGNTRVCSSKSGSVCLDRDAQRAALYRFIHSGEPMETVATTMKNKGKD